MPLHGLLAAQTLFDFELKLGKQGCIFSGGWVISPGVSPLRKVSVMKPTPNYRRKPLAAHIQYICANWCKPAMLYNPVLLQALRVAEAAK